MKGQIIAAIAVSWFGLFLCSGCATVGDLSNKPADVTKITGKTVVVVSDCLQQAFGKAPLISATGERTFVIDNGLNMPLATVTLTEVAEGTKVDLRKNSGLASPGLWRRCL